MTEREALVNAWVRTLHAMIEATTHGGPGSGLLAREPFIAATLELLQHLAPVPEPKR